ncbi:Sodium channel protein para [Eumeta japonica]|uniref:Sodium channel protein para n=1 Tax=Eumeta variegata TaxID=151549 RepID=A0A4C1SW85_EUMVA|nr:Sodium channel protein para [Eumeta japonica]
MSIRSVEVESESVSVIQRQPAPTSHTAKVRKVSTVSLAQLGSDRKPLVLSTYQDAQQHLPYADDSNAVTPMSEENGAIIVPVYYCNLEMSQEYTDETGKIKHHDNPLSSPSRHKTVVDMKG